jgi:nitrile hydratase subunit beta
MTGRFAAGERVRVRLAWPEDGPTQVHIRTPGYLRGHTGVVEAMVGAFPNPEDLAFGRPGLPAKPLYRVVFRHDELWPARSTDSVMADIYEHWLEPAR